MLDVEVSSANEEETQTVIIKSNGEQIILPPGVQIINENGTPYVSCRCQLHNAYLLCDYVCWYT